MLRLQRVTTWIVASALITVGSGCGGQASTRKSTASTPAPTVTGQQSAGKLAKASLRLDFNLEGYHAPFFLGLQRGYYKDEGIDLSIGQGNGATTTAQIIGHGADTFGVTDGTSLTALAAKGLKVKMVLAFIQKSGFAVTVSANSGIKTPQQLVGKRLAFITGGSPRILFPAFLKATGLKLSEMNLDSATPSDIFQLLQSGKVDGILCITFICTPVYASKGMAVQEIAYADYGVNVPEAGVIVSDATLEQDPELVRRFLKATVRALQDTIKDPSAAVDAEMKANPGVPLDRQVLMGELEGALTGLHTSASQGHPIGWMASSDWVAAQKILVQAGVIQHVDADVGAYYTNEYLPSS